MLSKLRIKLRNLIQDSNSLRLRWHKRLYGKPLWATQPVSVQLDTQNRCSLKDENGPGCVYCNAQNVYVKDYSVLPLSTIEHVLDTLKANGVYIAYVRAFGNGDTLLEPRLHIICEKIKRTLGCRIDVFTNGIPYANRFLLKDALLGDIHFTISGSTPQSYEAVHRKPKFNEAVQTLEWVRDNKRWNQRLWVGFVLFRGNAHDLENWRVVFKDYLQDVRPLHSGGSRRQSKKLDDSDKLVEYYREKFVERMRMLELPCSCFHSLAVGAKGRMLQCIDLDYTYNWGNVEEIDILEAWRKRLDVGLNHVGCRGCNQKNPDWKELFEKYVWN